MLVRQIYFDMFAGKSNHGCFKKTTCDARLHSVFTPTDRRACALQFVNRRQDSSGWQFAKTSRVECCVVERDLFRLFVQMQFPAQGWRNLLDWNKKNVGIVGKTNAVNFSRGVG